jgi:TonB-linked SusC/RagA family outer membrane protein
MKNNNIKKYIYRISLFQIGIFFLICNANAQNKVAKENKDSLSVISLNKNPKCIEPGTLLQIDKKMSTAAVAVESGAILFRTPVANITNTLYGRLPGLTVQQQSGEPGYDAASMAIRGVGTYDNSGLTVYVDGFQTSLSYFQYLSPSEIESIAVLKDAAALSIFGMKGANGVLWITTKRGTISKPKVQFQIVSGVQQAMTINKPLNSYEYAKLYNQAISNDGYVNNAYRYIWSPKYTDAQLAAYQNGTGVNVDWYDQVLKTNAPYIDGNLLFSGGDKTTKYAVVLDYTKDQGLYDVALGSTTSNAQIQRFNLRSNLDFNFFKIFEAKIDIGGRIEDRRYPNYAGYILWNDLASYPSNIYPVKDTTTGQWSGTTIYPNNPVGSIKALGWSSSHDRTLQANFSLKEKLDFITQGLYLNEAVSFNTWTRSSASKTATYARFYNGVQTTTDKTTDIVANGTSPTNQYDWKQATITLGYNRTFGLHDVAAVVNYYASNYLVDWGTNQLGLNTGNNIFYHYENIGGCFHYQYNEKYIAEFGFAISGSDNYAPGNRWGFYPAISAGWIVSNEKWLKNIETINFLKLRASVGKTGNDVSNVGRYLYQQYFSSNGSFYTGNNGLSTNTGLIQSYVPTADISAEKSMKYNIGAEATIFKKMSLTFDYFIDKRSGIITQDNSYLGVFGSTAPYRNVGKVTNKGFELSASFIDKIGKVGYTVGGYIAYAKNKIDYMAEVPPVNSFSKSTGLPIGTPIGLIATGLYQLSDFNANGTLRSSLPTSGFGTVQPGDIKYKDLDGNGVIDQNDVTNIGKPSLPQFTYAFNLGVNYKNIDLNVFFQGAGKRDVNIYSAAYAQTVAFVNNGNAYAIAQNAWAYYPSQGIDTRATATYPRLTTVANTNNYQNSTFWMKNGSFLRIRNIELGYTIPGEVLQKAHIEKLRIYISAVNPVTWSNLLSNYNIDPETNSGYPGLKSYNAGISLVF